MLIQDGLTVAYAHRSFAEYFVAEFFRSAAGSIREKIVPLVLSRVRFDNVAGLILEMDRDLALRSIVIPALQRVREIAGIRQKVGITHQTRFLKASFSHLEVVPGGVHAAVTNMGNHEIYPPFAWILENLEHEVGWPENYSNRKWWKDGPWSDPDADRLIKKYRNRFDDKESMIHVPIRHTDPVAREIMKGDGYFTIRATQAAMDLLSVLENEVERHASALASLLDA